MDDHWTEPAFTNVRFRIPTEKLRRFKTACKALYHRAANGQLAAYIDETVQRYEEDTHGRDHRLR